jgi:hypothetical protein
LALRTNWKTIPGLRKKSWITLGYAIKIGHMSACLFFCFAPKIIISIFADIVRPLKGMFLQKKSRRVVAAIATF